MTKAGFCGCADCDLRVRRVLVKKTVPGPDVPACVLKELKPDCPPYYGVAPPVLLPPPAGR